MRRSLRRGGCADIAVSIGTGKDRPAGGGGDFFGTRASFALPRKGLGFWRVGERMKTVHIYTDHGPISILLVAIKGAMVLFGIYLLAQAFWRGEVGQVLWLGLVLVAGGLFFGGYDLVKLLDRSPQLTFSPEGFVDHRVARPVVIPWEKFGSLCYRGGGSSGWSLEIFLSDGGHVLVPGSHLSVTPKELVRLVQEFAPQAEVDRRFRLWLG